MKKCKKLREYAQFIAEIRKYLDNQYNISTAVEIAMDECIKQGVLDEILKKHREEVRSMILTEYDEQAHIKNEREIALEEGEKIGIYKGRKMFSKLIQMLSEAGRGDEIERAAADDAYCEQLLKEFHLL